MTSPLRIVIAEDHYLVREGTRRALEDVGGAEVVAAVGNALELEVAVERARPDVVITDIRMPPRHETEGIDAAHRIRANHPGVGVLVLSQYAEADYALELLRDGNKGLGYLLKERVGDPEQLFAAVLTVAGGGSIVDPEVVATMVAHGRAAQSSPLRNLTDRELEVLEGMAQGRTNAGVAEKLHLSESSIEKYSTSIFSKLGLIDDPHVQRRVVAVLTFLHAQRGAQRRE